MLLSYKIVLSIAHRHNRSLFSCQRPVGKRVQRYNKKLKVESLELKVLAYCIILCTFVLKSYSYEP